MNHNANGKLNCKHILPHIFGCVLFFFSF